jgi:hypothetical protein
MCRRCWRSYMRRHQILTPSWAGRLQARMNRIVDRQAPSARRRRARARTYQAADFHTTGNVTLESASSSWDAATRIVSDYSASTWRLEPADAPMPEINEPPIYDRNATDGVVLRNRMGEPEEPDDVAF